MKILFNHLGFEADGRKRVLLQADAAQAGGNLLLLDAERQVVARGALQALGGVPGWRDWQYWQADFSQVRQPGEYTLWLEGSTPPLVSAPLVIADRVFGVSLLSDLLHYFKSQRCSGLYDRADRSAARHGSDERYDVHGGWFDASGDCSKYLSHLSYANTLNPQQTPLLVWALQAGRASLPAQPKWFDERMVDEALHGADFLLRMQHPDGFFFQTLFDNWSKDETRRELCAYRGQQGVRSGQCQAAFRQGGGMAIAALARAASLPRDGECRRADYLAAAERGFGYLQQYNQTCLDDGCDNLIDDYCALLAGCELYAATARPCYREAASQRLQQLLARQTSEGWFWVDAERSHSYCHASDAGLPYQALLRYLQVWPQGALHEEVLAALRRGLGGELARTAAAGNPFGYPRQHVARAGEAARDQFFMPHDNASGYWWQGENARLASLASAAWALAGSGRVAGDFQAALGGYAQDAVDWILGRNPFDRCMLQGHGRGNPHYEPGYYNACGGVCNGVTGEDVAGGGIAFLLPQQTDISQSWRWSEQWLPHGSWLFLALAQRAAAVR